MKNLSAAKNAALNITLDSVDRLTDRPWQYVERDFAVKALSEMEEFPLPKAAAVAWKLTGQVIKAKLV